MLDWGSILLCEEWRMGVSCHCYHCSDHSGDPLIESQVSEGGSRFSATRCCFHDRPLRCIDMLLALYDTSSNSEPKGTVHYINIFEFVRLLTCL